MGRTGKLKQVIIVAPQFPPGNLTAGHRARYFAMHLPKFGWEVKILSVKPRFYEEALDYELEKLLPADLEVIRTNAIPTRPLRLIGDIGIRSFWWHYRELCRLVREERIDLIYIPIPPNYSALLGPVIYKRFGIPYAIDYIDPWVHPWPGCEKAFSKAWASYHAGRLLEPIALKHVRLITAVAPGYYKGALERYGWLDESCCLAMPYGAEESDFRYLNNHPRPPYLFSPNDGDLHIVYAGAMLPRAYTTLKALFQGILMVGEKNPSIAQRLKFHFIGTGSNPSDPESFNIMAYAREDRLTGIVNESPARIAYLDVLNHLRHAHAVLILGSSEPHYTPSKVFQAVLAQRPVLALLHSKSTAVDVLNKSNAGRVVSFDEKRPVETCIAEISRALEEIASHRYSEKEVNWNVFRMYSAETVAKGLAEAFDQILESAKNNRCR